MKEFSHAGELGLAEAHCCSAASPPRRQLPQDVQRRVPEGQHRGDEHLLVGRVRAAAGAGGGGSGAGFTSDTMH